MNDVSAPRDRDGGMGQLLSYLGRNKRWWLLPILVMLGFMSVLIILGQSSLIAPFIYTLF